MADLSHWDFAENFSGYDAAALILGLEPRESDGEQWRIRVVTDRMELHYHCARERFRFVNWDIDDAPDQETKPDGLIKLMSGRMEEWRRGHAGLYKKFPMSAWLVEKQSQFDNQEFSRAAIARWLSAIGMNSVYSFDREQSAPVSAQAGRWPWGNHHTERLGHLEAAARRFWVNYDQTDPTTAPTSESVSAWLQSARNLSKTMADAIASILRADGLATGPRK